MTYPLTLYKPWMIARYGHPLFRIPAGIASSCPHGRCAFCAENGAKAQQILHREAPDEQIRSAIDFARRRYRAKHFMLYVQAFTADLANPQQQQQILDCLEQAPFEALSVGTRPDCLPDAALDFLCSLRDRSAPSFEIWVEPGVQTSCNRTLERIRRGHNWECSRQAILRLTERGLLAAPHVIIGLPGETAADWNRTAEDLAQLPLSGIKIHQLHLVKNTPLEKEYTQTPFPLLNHWDYAEALMDFLRRIPGGLPVMRIATDTPDDELVAPRWPIEKGPFLDYLLQQMTMREIRQGDLCPSGAAAPQAEPPGFPPVMTGDGSITFFSPLWKEHYHAKTGARLEALAKFVDPSGLAEMLPQRDVRLLDICFGLGTNSLAAMTQAAQCGRGRLDITALELDKRVVRAASARFVPAASDPLDWPAALSTLLSAGAVEGPCSTLSIRWGDARRLVQLLPDNSFDILFHDPFSSQHCPELWTVDFFRQLHRVMKPDGILLTYASAQPVRGALLEAGWWLAETTPGSGMGNGTVAALNSNRLAGRPQVGDLDPIRSIPYRDPSLCAPSKIILRNRQETLEQKTDGRSQPYRVHPPDRPCQ